MKSIFSFLIILVMATSSALAASSVEAASNEIIIQEYMFAPSTISIIAGTKVTWINHDEVSHTIVDGGTPKAFHSGALDTDDSYNFTFTKPGTYHYFCTLHPQMVGTIIVAAAK